MNEIKANLTLYLTPNQNQAMQGGNNAAGQSPTGSIISGQGDPQGKSTKRNGFLICVGLTKMTS